MVTLVSNEEYKKGLDVYYKHMPPEKNPVVSYLKKKILPDIKEKTAYLDIGAGSGDLAKIIAPFFQTTAVVEENPVFEEIYKEQKFDYHIGNFMGYNSTKNFDLILCSHVYYHVPVNQLEVFTKKMLNLLRPDGLLFIVLIAPRGPSHRLRLSLNENYIHSERIIKILSGLDVSVEKKSSEIKVSDKNFQKIHALRKLFVSVDSFANYPDKLTAEQIKTISQKIYDHSLSSKQNEKYVYQQDEDYLIIKR